MLNNINIKYKAVDRIEFFSDIIIYRIKRYGKDVYLYG